MDNLSVPDLAAAQNQKEVTINAQKNQLSGAIADFISVDLSAGDHTLTTAEFTFAMGFASTGNTVARTMNVPAIKRALFYVQNGGSFNLSVTRGTTTLTVPPGGVGFFQTDGTANGLISASPVALGGEIDVGFVFSGLPSNGQIVNYPINQSMKLVTALPGSNFVIGTNPTSTAVFTLKKNSTTTGTLSVSTGGAVTVSFTGDVSFAATDKFVVIAPSPQDATLADVGLNFKFVKV